MTTIPLTPPVLGPSTQEEIHALFPGLTAQEIKPISRLLDDFRSKIARPLLLSKDLEQDYADLQVYAVQLQQQTREHLAKLVARHPEIEGTITELIAQIDNVVEADDLVVLGAEAEVFHRALKMYSLQIGDLWQLAILRPEISDDDERLPGLLDHTVASEVDSRMCLAPIIFLLNRSIELPIRSALDNARTLIEWGNSFALNHVKSVSLLIQHVLSTPENTSVRHQYYSRMIEAFVGSGPEGVYESLLEERKLDAG